MKNMEWMIHNLQKQMDKTRDKTVTDAEIKRALKQMKSRKAPGIHNITGEAVRTGG